MHDMCEGQQGRVPGRDTQSAASHSRNSSELSSLKWLSWLLQTICASSWQSVSRMRRYRRNPCEADRDVHCIYTNRRHHHIVLQKVDQCLIHV